MSEQNPTVAGVISLLSNKKDFGFPWHDALMPINHDFTLLELAIYEAACAGSKSIWISVNDDWAPLIKSRIGDFVMDPVWIHRPMDPMPYENKKLIPIFLVPCLSKFYKTRDSEGWGYINAATYAIKSTRKISDFLTPDIFYATSPYVVYEPSYVTKFRKDILNKKRFMFDFENNNFFNDVHNGFTFLKDDIAQVRKYLNKNATMKYTLSQKYKDTGEGSILEKRRPEEQYSGKTFGLDQLFSHLDKKDYKKVSLNSSHHITDWSTYRKYMAEGKEFNKPNLLKRRSIFKILGDTQDD
tara:strand:+ start:70 stop:963 length:894 start_codon:yes stop_codon:yes gene_type:complete